MSRYYRKRAQNKAERALDDARDAAELRLLSANDDIDIINAIGEALHLKHRCDGRVIECSSDLLPSLNKMHQFVFPDEAAIEATNLAMRLLRTDTARGLDSVFNYHVGGECIPLRHLHERWRDEWNKGNQLRHPLSPLVKSFMELNPNAPDMNGTVIPTLLGDLGAAERNAKHAGEEFVLNGGAEKEWNLIELPGKHEQRAFPLRLYYLGGKPGSGSGRVAPLALRLFVECILSADLKATGMSQTIAMPTRDLLNVLYPNGWKPSTHLPLLMDAVDALGSRDARVPVRNGDGMNWLWQIVAVDGMPTDIESPLIMRVNLPMGSMRGPRINRDALRLFGVESAPLYRGLLNITYMMSVEGRTLFPRRVGRKRIYLHRTDPKFYGDKLVIEKTSGDLSSASKNASVELVRLFYPETVSRRDNNFRVHLERTLDKHLPRIIADRHAYIVDGRLLPPEAVGEVGKENVIKSHQASLIDDEVIGGNNILNHG